MPTLPALADLARISSFRLPVEPPPPHLPPDRPIVFLLDAATGLEDRLLRAWVDRLDLTPHPDVVNLSPSRIRRARRRTDNRVQAMVQNAAEPWFVPLRVLWMPAEKGGRRTVSWIDVAKLGDPRDPRWLRDYVILARRPDRVQIVVGNGADSAALRADHATGAEYMELVDFITRRAWRALDRAERAARGDRYKISRFVAEDLVNRPQFRHEVMRLGRERGLPEPVAVARARYYLAEISASHSPFVIDLIANLIHWIYRQGYGGIRYPSRSVADIAQLGRDYPVAFLPSHRSNLDRLALQFMLWENDLPPNHTAGGINMNFFPVGPLVRRTGVFFIRRSFKDNQLYKFVIKTYLDYLIEKRFPLEWYMEGGRSRSGKLRPPRLGMLSWVVDAVNRGKADDMYLLPVSIAYDQIQDVTAYAAEAGGAAKEKEGFSWALRSIAGLRHKYGDIHISFAEPISVRKELQGGDRPEDPLAVQKLAFEVMYRIGTVTPVTPTSVLAIVLLAARGNARDSDAIATESAALTRYIRRRDLPTTTTIDLSTPGAVELSMKSLVDNGLASCQTLSGRTVYWLETDEMLRASYYRNTVVHFFVGRGLAEVALSAPGLDEFWNDISDLRDLLKFEFFFAEKEEFRHQVSADLAGDVPDWEARVAGGKGRAIPLDPAPASWAVRPLLDAYMIVADELVDLDGELVRKEFLAACLVRGKLYCMEARVASGESVSLALFEGALLLAENRELLASVPGVKGERQRFANQVRGFVARLA
ncbi:glycerol-3-phosphate 1-O-acyltransferase [soil metagenome]